MIYIEFNPKKYRISAKGHAGSAPKGEDIVCAGVSALMGALAKTAVELADGGAFKKPAEGKVTDGDAEIRFYPKKGMEQTVSLIIYSTLCGLELIAEQYPQYAAFKVVG